MDAIEQELERVGDGSDRAPATKAAVELIPVAQGAEATIYKAKLFGDHTVAIKKRLPKRYRLPVLDEQLNRTRIIAEARALARAWLLPHVRVPAIYLVDPLNLRLVCEWIEGPTLREWLRSTERSETSWRIRLVLEQVGLMVASLHAIGLIHGDLTTSNFIVRDSSASTDCSVFIIDFGLAQQCPMHSDATLEAKAVDLYVLERAITSVHVMHAEEYLSRILQAYETCSTSKEASLVLGRLSIVRARGRKRTMVG
jgi:TP53 regulating kinase-like protein